MIGVSDGIGWYKLGEERDRAIYFIGIRDGRNSCAAGPWNYDMSQAPRVKYDSLLLLIEFANEISFDCAYWDEDWNEWMKSEGETILGKVLAFAEIRLPEAKP